MALNFIAAERLIHSLKTAIAASAAYLLALLIGQPADQWIVISVMVVMCAQIYVGSIIQKSYLRLLGTLLGCLTATATILFLNHSVLAIFASIALASFMFSYIATIKDSYSQMGTLGAVTTIIILFGNPPTLGLALNRFLEISVGIVIAALVSQFIFPIHARTHLRRAQATTLGQIKQYFSEAVTERFADDKTINNDLDEVIVKSLLIQRQLAKDSATELMGKRFDSDHFARTLYCEREVLRAINFMDIALGSMPSAHTIYTAPNPLAALTSAITSSLDVLVHVLKTNRQAGAHIHLPLRPELTEALLQRTQGLPAAEQVYLDGFIFAAEVLITNLRELALLYNLPVTPAPLPS